MCQQAALKFTFCTWSHNCTPLIAAPGVHSLTFLQFCRNSDEWRSKELPVTLGHSKSLTGIAICSQEFQNIPTRNRERGQRRKKPRMSQVSSKTSTFVRNPHPTFRSHMLQGQEAGKLTWTLPQNTPRSFLKFINQFAVRVPFIKEPESTGSYSAERKQVLQHPIYRRIRTKKCFKWNHKREARVFWKVHGSFVFLAAEGN